METVLIHVFLFIFLIFELESKFIIENKTYTNKEISLLGELIDVDGSCNHTVTYRYTYKNKDYLLTFVGDMVLLDPNKEAFEI